MEWEIPPYDANDHQIVQDILYDLSTRPKLVDEEAVFNLQQQLTEVQNGASFLLQIGDCAEGFDDCTPERVVARLDHFQHLQNILSVGLGQPVVVVGRMAGQYAKPRSQQIETRGTQTLLRYRGDLLNGFGFSQESRKLDPRRMLRAYDAASTTLELVQSHAHPCFVSHEALHLPYESALTRPLAHPLSIQKVYNSSAHMVWLGDRTRILYGPHVEYFSHLANPVGIKVGPTAQMNELPLILQRLNPENLMGKIVLIPRLGSSSVKRLLPPLIEIILASKQHVLWCLDPMHGNTRPSDESGFKTRYVEDILFEINETKKILLQYGASLNGLHLESTPDDVTECVGLDVDEGDLPRSYQTLCDPRLNPQQSELILRTFCRQESEKRL